MENATLVFKDINGQRNFETQCKKIKDQANSLIQVLNDLQPFAKIQTRDQAENLILDPLGVYDSIILQNIQLPNNNLQINVSALASLYNIPRNEFISKIGIDPGHVEGCESCKKPETGKRNKDVLTFEQYETHSKYLAWGNGFFDLNQKKIDLHKDSFNVYASSEKQKEYLKSWENLCKVFNDHIELVGMGTVQMETIAKTFDLLILDRKLIPNDIKIAEKLQLIK